MSRSWLRPIASLYESAIKAANSYDVGSCLSLSSEKGGCPLDSHAKGIETSFAQVRLSEIQDQWLKRIPEEQSVVMELGFGHQPVFEQ